MVGNCLLTCEHAYMTFKALMFRCYLGSEDLVRPSAQQQEQQQHQQ